MELLNSRMKESSQRWLHLQALLQSFYSKHFISLGSFLSHLHFTETSVWKHLLHSETGLLVEWRSPLCLLLLCASWPQEGRSGASNTRPKLHPKCSFHSLSKVCISLSFRDAGLASERLTSFTAAPRRQSIIFISIWREMSHSEEMIILSGLSFVQDSIPFTSIKHFRSSSILVQIPGAEVDGTAQCHGRRSMDGDPQAPRAAPDRVPVPWAGKVPVALQEQRSLGHWCSCTRMNSSGSAQSGADRGWGSLLP